jgi:hypothetical protein
MKPLINENGTSAFERNAAIRNPFGVMDVPDPADADVLAFAANALLGGSPDDDNAKAWSAARDGDHAGTIEGNWASRWNGGADPTVPGDAADKWKQGEGKAAIAGERVYLLFDWHDGVRKGLIDARREGADRLVGKYINLSDPKITQPWIGLILSDRRIDGRWPRGRLDFRR